MISRYIKSSKVKEVGEEEIIMEIILNKKAMLEDLQKGLGWAMKAVCEFTEKIVNLSNTVLAELLSDLQEKDGGENQGTL